MVEESEPFDVSIVIPAFNVADTIGAQLDAVARQDFDGRCEVIVALQESTDDTERVLELRTDDNLRVVDASARRGAGFARNVGVEAARSELIAFCDADDIVADDWLSQLMTRRSLAPVLAGGRKRFSGELTPQTIAATEMELPVVQCDFLPTAYSCNMLVQRSALVDVGGFDLYFHRRHDVELAWRLQVAGYRVEVVPEAVIYYRERSDRRRTWVQNYRWARYDPALYRRYARHGMARSMASKAIRSWWRLISLIPFLGQRARREWWLRQSALRAGRLVGSFTERTVYL